LKEKEIDPGRGFETGVIIINMDGEVLTNWKLLKWIKFNLRKKRYNLKVTFVKDRLSKLTALQKVKSVKNYRNAFRT
jgi:hypothetical protein